MHYQLPQDKRLKRVPSHSDWEIEQHDSPFDFHTIHIASKGKLNEVTSVDDIAESFLDGGGSIVREKLIIPGVASLISCEDANGHVFSFIENNH